MDASIVPILTPYNYFEWKYKMVIYLKGNGYHRVTIGLETKPQDVRKRIKSFNKCEVFDTLYMSVSPNLHFDIESLNTPNGV